MHPMWADRNYSREYLGCHIVLKTCTVLTKNTISNHETFSFEDFEILTVNQTFTVNYTGMMINKKQIHNSEINTTQSCFPNMLTTAFYQFYQNNKFLTLLTGSSTSLYRRCWDPLQECVCICMCEQGSCQYGSGNTQTGIKKT